MGLLLTSWTLEWMSLGVVILLTYLYYYFNTCYSFWKKKGVKYVEPLPIFGNLTNFVLMKQSIGEVYKDLYNKFPEEPYIGAYDLNKPSLLIRDTELIKIVLVKDFSSFQDRGKDLSSEKQPLSQHLLSLTGKKWRNLRMKLTPTFTSGKMKMMFHVMTECSEQLVEYLENPASKEETLEIKEVLAKFTTDVIGSCAFGLQCNAMKNEESEFRAMGKRLFSPTIAGTLLRQLRISFPFLFKILNFSSLSPDITKFFLGVVKDSMEYREKNNVIRNDFLHLLMQLKKTGNVHDGDADNEEKSSMETVKNGTSYGKKNGHKTDDTELEITDNLLASQAFVFFIAGFETSSTTLSFCLYELALNPDIQEKLRESIKSTVNKCGGKITYDGLQSDLYLEKVINETLRKHPPATLIRRMVTKPYVIPGTSVKLEVGDAVAISIYGLHHDPKHFPEPERFNPENFSEEAKAARHHYAYLPFGEGPRNCIGMRFGLLQTKLGLAALLLNYEFSVSEKTSIPMKMDPKQLILTSAKGTWLKIKKIKA